MREIHTQRETGRERDRVRETDRLTEKAERERETRDRGTYKAELLLLLPLQARVGGRCGGNSYPRAAPTAPILVGPLRE